MNQTRREFLQMIGCATLAGAFAPFGAWAEAARGRKLVFSRADSICVVTLDTLEQLSIPIDFRGHSFIPTPNDPARPWAIHKWGPHAAEIDIVNGAITRRLESPSGTQFYGHGVYWPKQNLLLIGCVDSASGQGKLAGYDHASLKHTAMFDATPGGLHECLFNGEDRLLIISTGLESKTDYAPQAGPRLEPSSIVELDLSSGKVVGRKPIGKEDDDIFLNHFVRLHDGTVVAVSNVRPGKPSPHGNVYIASGQERELRKVKLDAPLEGTLTGELLSVAADDKKKIVGITNPASSTVFFVDAAGRKSISHFHQEAGGIAFDKGHGFLSSGLTALMRFDSPMSPPSQLLPNAHDGTPVGGVAHCYII